MIGGMNPRGPKPVAPPSPTSPAAAGTAPPARRPTTSVKARPKKEHATANGSNGSAGHAGDRAPARQPPAVELPHFDPAPLLFEVGWEVCWQLGGIYTVLRTKAPAMQRRWGDRYTLVGPYNPVTAASEFEETPAEGMLHEALEMLRDQGIGCHHGRWLVQGRPRVVLLDYHALFGRLHEDKYLLWQDHGIATDAGDGEVNEVVAFGMVVTRFFQALSHLNGVKTGGARPIIGHFHEWMAGVAVPRIAHLKLPVCTVFTTHATLLGRYLAADNPAFYSHLPYFDADAEADKYRIGPRHRIEKAAAHASTVFTTVSTITALEAESLLGRNADVLLPNGLDIQRFEAPHEFQYLHNQYKEAIHEFVMGHFFPSYTFDLNNTIYLFTAGRYEYTNKGIDLFVEALYRLNQRLKGTPGAPTVVAFIVTRADVRSVNVEVLQNQAQLDELKNFCESVQAEIGRQLFLNAARGRQVGRGELITEETQIRLKRAMHAMRNTRLPPIITHDLNNDAADPVLNHLRYRGMINAADDPVKVVFHPQFVTATSPLIGLDYDQFVRGCHLGVFPSYYEPWGYTPMECAALGIPAVTTDLSGFGAYLDQTMENPRRYGLQVLKRREETFNEAAEELTTYLLGFCGMTRRQRIELRNRVESVCERFDWSELAIHYHDAHDLALARKGHGHAVEVRQV